MAIALFCVAFGIIGAAVEAFSALPAIGGEWSYSILTAPFALFFATRAPS